MSWSVVKDSDSIRGPTGICCDFGVGSKSDEIRCSLPTNFGQVQCRAQSAVHVLRLPVLPLTPESDGKIADGQQRVWMLCPEHTPLRFEHRALQAHAAVASDPIDTSFSSALHAASLPLRVEVERLSRGSYKVMTLALHVHALTAFLTLRFPTAAPRGL